MIIYSINEVCLYVSEIVEDIWRLFLTAARDVS